MGKIFPDRTRISITDTGIGILLEKVDQLFQPYNRLGLEEGMGIGLTVIKNSWTVGMTSPEGEGSMFWIELRTIDL